MTLANMGGRRRVKGCTDDSAGIPKETTPPRCSSRQGGGLPEAPAVPAQQPQAAAANFAANKGNLLPRGHIVRHKRRKLGPDTSGLGTAPTADTHGAEAGCSTCSGGAGPLVPKRRSGSLDARARALTGVADTGKNNGRNDTEEPADGGKGLLAVGGGRPAADADTALASRARAVASLSSPAGEGLGAGHGAGDAVGASGTGTGGGEGSASASTTPVTRARAAAGCLDRPVVAGKVRASRGPGGACARDGRTGSDSELDAGIADAGGADRNGTPGSGSNAKREAGAAVRQEAAKRTAGEPQGAGGTDGADRRAWGGSVADPGEARAAGAGPSGLQSGPIGFRSLGGSAATAVAALPEVATSEGGAGALAEGAAASGGRAASENDGIADGGPGSDDSDGSGDDDVGGAGGADGAGGATRRPRKVSWTHRGLAFLYEKAKYNLSHGLRPDYDVMLRRLGLEAHPQYSFVLRRVQAKYGAMLLLVEHGLKLEERLQPRVASPYPLVCMIQEVMLGFPSRTATAEEVVRAIEADPSYSPFLDRRPTTTDRVRKTKWEKQVVRILSTRITAGFYNTDRKRGGRVLYSYDPNLDARRNPAKPYHDLQHVRPGAPHGTAGVVSTPSVAATKPPPAPPASGIVAAGTAIARDPGAVQAAAAPSSAGAGPSGVSGAAAKSSEAAGTAHQRRRQYPPLRQEPEQGAVVAAGMAAAAVAVLAALEAGRDVGEQDVEAAVLQGTSLLAREI